jgi:hypothetical protein
LFSPTTSDHSVWSGYLNAIRQREYDVEHSSIVGAAHPNGGAISNGAYRVTALPRNGLEQSGVSLT